MSLRRLAAILLLATVAAGAGTKAFAHDDWYWHERQEWRQRAWHEHERREHEWREHEWRERYYAQPFATAPRYIAPPPPYYVDPGWHR